MHCVTGHTVLCSRALYKWGQLAGGPGWCTRALYKCTQLAGGPSAQGTIALCNRSYCPGVVVLCTHMLN